MTAAHTLPSELTIYTVAEVHQHFMQLVNSRSQSSTADEQKDMVFKASAVAEVDAAGLQLLLSLSRYLAARDEHLVLSEPSECLIKACNMLRLQHLLAEQTAGAHHAH